jgi:hypothetical protein
MAYLVFYMPRGHGIEVVRILHGARDIERLLVDDTVPTPQEAKMVRGGIKRIKQGRVKL